MNTNFFVKDIGLDFLANLLISGSLKAILSEAEYGELESVFSSKTVSFSFLEIAQAVLVEVRSSVFTFQSEGICSAFSMVLA